MTRQRCKPNAVPGLIAFGAAWIIMAVVTFLIGHLP